jgi:hypothetical protein
MFTCIALRHAPLEWQKNKGVHLQASKSKLNVDSPDPSNNFNHKSESGKNESCCAATSPKLLTSPGIPDTYTFLMTTWNSLPVSSKQTVYSNSLATFMRHIQQMDNPKPAVVISMEAERVHNPILLENVTSKVSHEKPEIGSTDPNIPIDNNCTDDEHDFVMSTGSGDYEKAGDESEMSDTIPTASRPGQPSTELERFVLGTCDVHRYECEDADDADGDVDEEEESSQADDRSTQNVEG